MGKWLEIAALHFESRTEQQLVRIKVLYFFTEEQIDQAVLIVFSAIRIVLAAEIESDADVAGDVCSERRSPSQRILAIGKSREADVSIRDTEVSIEPRIISLCVFIFLSNRGTTESK